MKKTSIENLKKEQAEIYEMAFFWILENHVDLKRSYEWRFYEIIYDMAISMIDTLYIFANYSPKEYLGQKMSFDDFNNVISFAMHKNKNIVMKYHEFTFFFNIIDFGVSQEELEKYFK